ncbi:MAG: inositol monophosphatase family protein [Planctomycetota bacterium]|nr:inositol monophosphatase family protein [Planctomycetota bacterium]
MKLSRIELARLAELAIEAATAAGEMIGRSRPQKIEHKSDHGSLASQVVTDVDRRSESMIIETLKPTFERFELGLLTEEQSDDGGRFDADHFWCVDPIDGTLPFIEGTPGYAVSIGLVRRDGTPAIGVIYDPVEKTMYHAIDSAGAFRDGHPWIPPSTSETLTLFTDRSFLSSERRQQVTRVLEEVAGDLALTGLRVDTSAGAVMNACKTLTNPMACYLKLPKQDGGGSLWDYAATACLFKEAGSVATDVYGADFELNRSDSTLMGHRGILFATHESLAKKIRALLTGET